MTTLIFDFDGTIVDSSGDVLASLAFAMRCTGLVPTRPLEVTLIGSPLPFMIQEAVNDISDRDLQRAVAAFREHYDGSGYPSTILYPGVRELLQALGESGTRSYIATNKPRHATVSILERLGIADAFSSVLCIDDYPGAHKFGLVGELVRRHRQTMGWMVGDAPADIRAGKAHQLRTVAHLGGYSNPALLLAEEPDYTVECMGGLLPLLNRCLAFDND